MFDLENNNIPGVKEIDLEWTDEDCYSEELINSQEPDELDIEAWLRQVYSHDVPALYRDKMLATAAKLMLDACSEFDIMKQTKKGTK